MMNGVLTKEEACSSHDQVCCLFDEDKKCTRLAGNAAYNKRIQRTVYQKKLKLSLDTSSSHNHICEYHKSAIQSVRGKRKRRDSDEDSGDEPLEVDMSALHLHTLRKYKKHYKLSPETGLGKDELVAMVTPHFRTLPVHEKEALTYFFYCIKTSKFKLDPKYGSNVN